MSHAQPLGADFANQIADLVAAKLTPPRPQVITFGELFSLYYEKHVLVHLKNSNNAHYFFNVHGPRWKDVPVDQIRRQDVQVWIDDYGTKSRSAAVRAVNMMSAIINWGMRRDHIPQIVNPCVGVQKFQLKARERFAAPAELARLKTALAKETPIMRDLFWMCLLTGQRRGNVLSMRWDEIDFDLATWTIPAEKFKNGSSHTVPLTALAISILKRRMAVQMITLEAAARLTVGSQWVFPGKRPGRHIAEPKRAWERVLKRAGITELTIHDLRRTLGSYMAMAGHSQYIIARALGHKDIRSTNVYARLDLKPVRNGMELVAEQWQELMSEPTQTNRQPQIAVTVLQNQPMDRYHGQLTPAQQVLVEARLLRAMAEHHARRGVTKSQLLRKFNGGTCNARELDRILSELQNRQIVDEHQDDQGVSRFSLRG